MALFGMRIKRRREKIGGFHAQYIDKGAKKKRHSMGIGRTFSSATTLIIGGAMCYISLHYIPAYLGGFYRFDEKVTLAPNNVRNYRVIWSRA